MKKSCMPLQEAVTS